MINCKKNVLILLIVVFVLIQVFSSFAYANNEGTSDLVTSFSNNSVEISGCIKAGPEHIVNIFVKDGNGNIIYVNQSKTKQYGAYAFTLSTDELKDGIYYINLISDNKEYYEDNFFIGVEFEDDKITKKSLFGKLAAILNTDLKNDYVIYDMGIDCRSFSDYITNEELAVLMVRVWEIKCGEMECGASSTFIKDYDDIEKKYSEYIDKATQIGAVITENNYFYPKRFAKVIDANKALENVAKSIDIMSDVIDEPVFGFKSDGKTVYEAKTNQKSCFFISLPDMEYFNKEKLQLAIAIYENGRLKDISFKKYSADNNCNLLYTSINTENCSNDDVIKAFLWGDENKPIKEAEILKFEE